MPGREEIDKATRMPRGLRTKDEQALAGQDSDAQYSKNATFDENREVKIHGPKGDPKKRDEREARKR